MDDLGIDEDLHWHNRGLCRRDCPFCDLNQHDAWTIVLDPEEVEPSCQPPVNNSPEIEPH